MNLLTRLSHIIGVLFDPRFYVRFDKVSDTLSDTLEKLMDQNTKIIHDGRYTIKFKGCNYFIWIENKYYSYGCVHKPFQSGVYFLPRRKTALRLEKYILDQILLESLQ